MKTKPTIIRQGDVILVPVKALPEGCIHIEPEGGRAFVLAFGEKTGHQHALYEFTVDQDAEHAAAQARAEGAATEIMEAALERARTRRTAQMWAAPDGEWYLEVRQPTQLRHEEHTAPTIPPGIYHCPVQVEAGPDNMARIVAD